MPYVFLSYAREDSETADALRDAMEAHDPPVEWFIDRHCIRPGEDYTEALDSALSSASLVCAVLTRRSAHKEGVLDEFVKAKSLGKPVVKVCLGDPREFADSPFLQGSETTEQLIVGSQSDPPTVSDYALFAKRIGEALLTACDVDASIKQLRRRGRKTDSEVARLKDLGHLALKPVASQMRQVIDRVRIVQRERGVQDEVDAEFLYRLADVLAHLLRQLMARRKATGRGAEIHPEAVDQQGLAELLAEAMAAVHRSGSWWYHWSIAEAAAQLDQSYSIPVFSSLAEEERVAFGEPYPDSVLVLASCGDADALKKLMLLIEGKSEWAGVELDARARRELMRGLGQAGGIDAALSLERWSEGGAGSLAVPALEAARAIRLRLEGSTVGDLMPRTVWLPSLEGTPSARYSGLAFTAADVVLALHLFEAGDLRLDDHSWRLPRVPATLRDLERGSKHALYHVGLDGNSYALGPKDVFRLVEILLDGSAVRPVSGGKVNAPFKKLGFPGTWDDRTAGTAEGDEVPEPKDRSTQI